MSEDKERAAFEDFYLVAHPAALGRATMSERDGDGYAMLRVQGAWEGWTGRASLAQQAGEDARDGWQPIATAPKDEFILLAGEFDWQGDWRIKMGEFRSSDTRWHILGGSWTPSRWQHLPPPPAIDQAMKGGE